MYVGTWKCFNFFQKKVKSANTENGYAELTYVIESVQKSDAGMYICRAYVDEKKVYEEKEILIQGKFNFFFVKKFVTIFIVPNNNSNTSKSTKV